MSYPILSQPALSIAGMARYKYTDELAARFIIKGKFEDSNAVNIAEKNGQWLYVPRNCAVIGSQTKVQFTDGHWSSKILQANKEFPPRNAVQQNIIDESSTLLHEGVSHIIQASTGIGKTYIGCCLAVELNKNTLVVVTKEDLMGEEQWGGALKKFTNLTEDDIGIIQQEKCEVEGKKVVLAMVHSLAQREYPAWINDYFGFIIFDEVHRMGAETFHKVCGMFSAKLRLGLSAGTNQKALRNDGKDFVFKAHIGEVLVKGEHISIPPKVLVVSSDFKLPRTEQSVKQQKDGTWRKLVAPMKHEPGKLMHIYKMMARNQARNSLIIEFVMEAYETGRHVLVLSDLSRNLHLNLLAEMAVSRGVSWQDIGFYISGMKEVERDEHKMRRIVFGTYGMCAESTDVPQWDSLVMATPRSNVKQAVGRVLRQHEGKKEPVILDIVDTDSWVCGMYYKNRLKFYESSEIKAKIEIL